VTVTVHVNRLEEWPEAAGLAHDVRRAAQAALAATDVQLTGEMSITFVTDDEIRALNRKYLDHDRPTDVISFQLGAPGEILGDVYIAPAVARRNAAGRNLSANHEVLRLVIHGTLHALGLEHPEGPDREESEMFRLQEDLLRGLISG
jgi:probable rRNA maturation factor